MVTVGIEIGVILVLIVLNGIFSMSELAVVVARKARLQGMAEAGKAGARVAIDLAASPNRFLSTVQIGITLIGVLTGAFGGARLASGVEPWIEPIPFIGDYSAGVAFALVVLCITYLTLIVGELIPKRLAMQNPEGVATLVARPMRVISSLFRPAVAVLSASTEAGLRVLGIANTEDPPVTENEIRIMIGEGAAAGTIREVEEQLAVGVFELGDLVAANLMTPRPSIIWVAIDDPEEEARRTMTMGGHSEYPICDGDLDHVIGIVAVKALWAQNSMDLRQVAREAIFVPETAPALEVMEMFKATGQHLALVVDEHGGIEGIITLHDILEAIVGELDVFIEPSDGPAIRRDDASWLIDGMMPLHEAQEILEIDDIPENLRGEVQTLGGLVMYRLGRVPATGDRVELDTWILEVADMDDRRVDKVLAIPAEPADQPN